MKVRGTFHSARIVPTKYSRSKRGNKPPSRRDAPPDETNGKRRTSMKIYVTGLSTGFLVGGAAGFVAGTLFIAQMLGII